MTEETRKLRVRLAYWLLPQVPVIMGLAFWERTAALVLVSFGMLSMFGIAVGVHCFLKQKWLPSVIALPLFTLALIQAWLPVLTQRHMVPAAALLWIVVTLLVLLHIANFLEVGMNRRCGMLFVFLLVQDGFSGFTYAAAMSFAHTFKSSSGFPFGVGLALGLGIPWGFLLAGTALSFGISAIIRRRQSREAA